MPATRHPNVRAAALLVAALLVGCTPAPASPGPTSADRSSPDTSPGASTAIASGGPVSGGASPEPSVAPPRWRDCGEGFVCADLKVPRDYDDPANGSLSVALIRLPASDPEARIGSLVVNPGGPGGSGVEFVREGFRVFPKALRKRFDLVGFDPRGVNASSAVRCIDNLDGRAQLDPSPDTSAELRALAADAKAYAEACGKRNAELLPYLSTDAVVRDLDLIRQAVGDEDLTYLGFSYGTLIGSLYAERYPDHIRALALDGALDPSLDLEHLRSGQARAFETELRRFLADCARQRICAFNHGSGTTRAFDRLMASIDRKPLPTPRARDRRSVGPGLASSAVLGAMYGEGAWPALAAGLALAEEGDGSLLLLIADPFRGRKPNGSYSNQLDAYTSNICLDFPAPTEVKTFTGWADALEGVSPHFAQQIAYNDLACAYWPTPATGQPHRVSAPGAPPLVIVGSTGDPATPYAWSKALASQLETARLVTRRGEGHTGYLVSPCVSKAVDAYLIDLKAPRDGLTCD
jgi:pimeloyl-ACP methyl ester carboxylesterase